MRKLLIGVGIAAMAAAVIGGALSVPAFADRDDHGRNAVQNVRIEPKTMRQKINDLGYEVRGLKIVHRRYEAHLVEKTSGGAVKALFDGTTGELVRAELHE